MGCCKHACFNPLLKPVMNGTGSPETTWEGVPLTPCPKDVKDPRQERAIIMTRTSTMSCGRMRRDVLYEPVGDLRREAP